MWLQRPLACCGCHNSATIDFEAADVNTSIDPMEVEIEKLKRSFEEKSAGVTDRTGGGGLGGQTIKRYASLICRRSDVWRPMIIVFVLFLLQQFCGLSTISFYAVNVLAASHSSVDEVINPDEFTLQSFKSYISVFGHHYLRHRSSGRSGLWFLSVVKDQKAHIVCDLCRRNWPGHGSLGSVNFGFIGFAFSFKRRFFVTFVCGCITLDLCAAGCIRISIRAQSNRLGLRGWVSEKMHQFLLDPHVSAQNHVTTNTSLQFYRRTLSIGSQSWIDWFGQLFWKLEHFSGGENVPQSFKCFGAEWCLLAVFWSLCSQCHFWTLCVAGNQRQAFGRYQ